MSPTSDSDTKPRSSHCSGIFAYNALPDSSKDIRLLKIEHGKSVEEIFCSLSTFALSKAPRYAAISYTWGEPSLTHHIVLNGFRVAVRKNCHSALLQVREMKRWYHSRSKYVWIDAICTNQEDLNEKSHQVHLMGDIFSRASCVYASLGWHIHGIELLFKSPWTLLDEIQRLNDHSAKQTLNTKLVESFHDAFEIFSRQAYFTRVWVVQELVLASKVKVLCGPYTIDWNLVEKFNWLYWESQYSLMDAQKQNPAPNSHYVSGVTGQRGSLSRLHDASLKRLLSARNVWTFKRRRILFKDVISDFRQLQCSDPRDHVYGFLSIMDLVSSSIMYPDYEKPCFEVAGDCFSIAELDDYDGPIDLAERLVKTLRLPSESTEMQREITVRREAFLEAFLEETTDGGRAFSSPKSLKVGDTLRNREPLERSNHHIWSLLQRQMIQIQQSGSDTCCLTSANTGIAPHHNQVDINDLYLRAVAFADEFCIQVSKHGNMYSPRPRILKCGSRIAGILCARSQPGDYLYRWHSKHYNGWSNLRPCLILRRNGDAFEIMGQGLLSPLPYVQKYVGTQESHLSYEQLDLHLDEKDMLVYAAQDLTVAGPEGSLHVGDRDLQLQRLFTGVTSKPWSSIALGIGPRMENIVD